MKASLAYCFLICFFVIACAQKVDRGLDPYAIVYNESMGSEEGAYFSCNIFADETFRGSVWNDSDSSSYAEACVYLKIEASPKDLLKNEDFFLQIYPFFVKDGAMDFDSSLRINTIRESVGNGAKEIVMESAMIDTYLVQAKLRVNPDHFFLDHFFEICDIKDEWDGLQLVVYERKREEAVYVRTTKFLLPPFLIHPEHFRNERGDALAAYHPFLEFIPEFKSTPSSYYDYAERICNQIF